MGTQATAKEFERRVRDFGELLEKADLLRSLGIEEAFNTAGLGMPSRPESIVLKGKDLTPAMVALTNDAYDRYTTYARALAPKEGVIDEVLIGPLLDLAGNILLPGDVVMHAGCGTAYELYKLVEAGYVGVGIDRSSTMIDQATKRFGRGLVGEDKVYFLQQDIREVDFASIRPKLIIAESMLRHLPWEDVERVMQRMYKGLIDDGIALLAFREGDGRVMATIDPINGQGYALRYSNTCSEDFAQKLIERCGFKVMQAIHNEHPMTDGTTKIPGWITFIVGK